MRCAICNTDSDTVTLVEDCSDCQQAIFDCLAGYPDLDNNEEMETLDADFS